MIHFGFGLGLVKELMELCGYVMRFGPLGRIRSRSGCRT